MNDKKNIIALSWNEIDAMTNLIKLWCEHNFMPEVIVGTGKGGLIPAIILSNSLNVSLRPAMDYRIDEDHVFCYIGPYGWSGNEKKILVVSDISNTGSLLKKIMKSIGYCLGTILTLQDYEIKVVTIAAKEDTELKPDYYPLTIKSEYWVRFPWEN